MSELSENVKTKIAELVQEISDEILVGKPALLAQCMYFNIERTVKENIDTINEDF